MLQIAIQPIPSQRVSAVLGDQNCQISLYQKPQGLFADIVCNGENISLAVIVRDAVALNPRTFAAFVGNLYLIDTQGSEDAYYTGLGSRFQLIYLTADEIALIP